MSCIGQAGRCFVFGCLVGVVPAVCSAQSSTPASGAAKISGPIAAEVTDPFATFAPIPTPIVTSSGRVAEAAAASKPPVAGLLPIVPAVPAPPVTSNVIDAGKLVPIEPLSKPQVILPGANEKLPETAAAGLKPIQPASISRETVTPPKAKPAAVKKPAPKPKSVEKPSEQVAPAVNFSFPQPVIPLESALRRFFNWSASRKSSDRS